jgi:hypothetical protein
MLPAEHPVCQDWVSLGRGQLTAPEPVLSTGVESRGGWRARTTAGLMIDMLAPVSTRAVQVLGGVALVT